MAVENGVWVSVQCLSKTFKDSQLIPYQILSDLDISCLCLFFQWTEPGNPRAFLVPLHTAAHKGLMPGHPSVPNVCYIYSENGWRYETNGWRNLKASTKTNARVLSQCNWSNRIHVVWWDLKVSSSPHGSLLEARAHQRNGSFHVPLGESLQPLWWWPNRVHFAAINSYH